MVNRLNYTDNVNYFYTFNSDVLNQNGKKEEEKTGGERLFLLEVFTSLTHLAWNAAQKQSYNRSQF